MKREDIFNLKTKGYVVLRKWVSDEWLDKIDNTLPIIFEEHKKIRENNNNSITSNEVAMNALVSDDIFIDFLQEMIDTGLIKALEENYFGGKCILNSFSAISNIKSESDLFYKKVHRDIRGYSGNIPLLLNILVMVDDFTIDNGGTLLLPYSHLIEEKPPKEFWEKNCESIIGKRGDVIIWNSNIFHSSGINRTTQNRRGLPITFSLPYYKQLLDYPRAIGYERINDFSEKMRQVLGYDYRVPSSLNEWYSSDEDRLYK